MDNENEYVKKLTGKNNRDFEYAAAHIVNDSDVGAFQALVAKSDFLFDFIKENVKKRLSNAITKDNYKNLFKFLKIYSSDYEDLFVSTFVKFANEDMTDGMLNLLENGADEEKAYAAKYFSSINDTLAIELLRKYSYSEFAALAMNCAEALSALHDTESYDDALKKLDSDDEYEKLSAVSFLVAFKDKKAIGALFEVMKKTSMPENVASEIPYLQNYMELLDSEYKDDVLLAVNYLINGLGEILSLSQVFDFEMFDLLEKLYDVQSQESCSKAAVCLLNAKFKFEQLTENDEYIYDEEKVVKEEIRGIKEFLDFISQDFWDEQIKLFQEELDGNSKFVFFALELVHELNLSEALDKLKGLLVSSNQTIILKTVEIIKSLNKLNEIDKITVLEKISDENIRLIIESLF